MKFSRRGFAGFLLAPLFRLNGQSTGDGAGVASRRTQSRTYRAGSVILLLGIPIFRRAGVGGGQASLEETGEGASLRRTLFFAAGSDPKRAHGLSRLGWIREVVLGPDTAPSEADYFGVLTSSPEESLEHARKSVDASPSGRSTFAAVNGRNTAGHSTSAVTHFEFSAGAIWSDRGLIDQAAVAPYGAGGEFEMGDGARAVAGGIAAVHGGEGAAAGWRGIHRLAGVLQTLFGRRSQHSEVVGFGRSGIGPKYDFANPAEPAQPVGALGVRTGREEEGAAQRRAFAGLFQRGLSATYSGAPENRNAEQQNYGAGAIGAGLGAPRGHSRAIAGGLSIEAKQRGQ